MGLDRLGRLEAFLEEDPGNASLLGEAFDVALQLRQLDRAAALVERAGRRDAAWCYRSAIVQALRGDPAAALGDLREAARDLPAPWPAAVQVLWLRLHHQLGHLEEAWQWIEAARPALDATAAGVASLIAIDLERFSDALSLAEQALVLEAPPAEALVARGTVALAQRDVQAAKQWLHAARQDPSAAGRASSALGYASLLEQDLAGAVSNLAVAVQRLPQHIGSWLGLGWARLLQGERDAALDTFRRALELDPAFGESQAAVGLVLAMLGDPGAAEHLERAERLDRGGVTARYARALLAGEAAELGQLQRLAQRILGHEAPLGGRLSDWLVPPRSGRSG